MAEDTQQAIQTPETITQDASTPNAEQQTPAVVDETKQDGLPEEASDRTKSRFDELTTQLREERQRREALEGAFSAMQPKPALEPMFDPNTGFVNENALTDIQRRTIKAEERATKAEEAVQSYLLDQENRRAYEAHPESNPDDKQFDKELKKRAAAIILHSMVNPQDYNGKQLSLKEAYDYLKGTQNSAVAEAKKEGAQQAIEQLTPKEQAALEATGTSAGRSNVAQNLDTLRRQTRRGSLDAIVTRLQGLKTQA
jgi:Glu-tRNA(Gln) amidotransferase subunit E-like FAD-binding protein